MILYHKRCSGILFTIKMEMKRSKLPLVLFVFSCLVTLNKGQQYPTADHHWSLQQTNYTVVVDLKGQCHGDLHGVNFVHMEQLGYVSSLNGKRQWIDFDAGPFASDCIGNPSYCAQGLSLGFWIRMRGGSSLLSTGGLTNSTNGTGLQLTFDSKSNMLNSSVKIIGKMWSIKARVFPMAWCYMTLTWSAVSGLKFYLDGDVTAVDKKGRQLNTFPSSFSKMITIAKPMDLMDLSQFGSFDMAHFVVWYYELTSDQVYYLVKNALQETKESSVCCFEKSVDICYRDPCSSKGCKNLEKKYTRCACPQLEHRTCAGKYRQGGSKPLKTSPKPVTMDRETVVFTETVDPESCRGLRCHRYSTCRISRGTHYCSCPHNCSSDENRVCGSNGRTYINECTLKEASCKTKKDINVTHEGVCDIHFKTAKHYWPMNNFSSVGMLMDEQGKGQAVAYNGAQRKATEQLGHVVALDGIDDWIRITGFGDSCIIDPSNCDEGLTVAVWLRLFGGEYVISAGNYAAQSNGPGYRFYKNIRDEQYVLELSTWDQIWRLVIHTLPTDWFHLAFTWSPSTGLKLYVDAQLLLWSKFPLNITSAEKSEVAKVIVIGRPDSLARLRSHGRMDIGHFVIWKNVLGDNDVNGIYSSLVTVTPESTVCCYFKNGARCLRYPCFRFTDPAACQQMEENYKCICPEIKRPGQCMERTFQGICEDRRSDCPQLAQQTGYCNQFQFEMEKDCPVSCEFCAPLQTSTIHIVHASSYITTSMSLISAFTPLLHPSASSSYSIHTSSSQSLFRWSPITSLSSSYSTSERLSIIESSRQVPAYTLRPALEPSATVRSFYSQKIAPSTHQSLNITSFDVRLDSPTRKIFKPNLCRNDFKAPKVSRRRLSRETLIFALTGCILGIIFLLLVSIYSWKVYRSKYSGAFLPPKTPGSLIEVDETYDGKWTKKYIDSCAFQIKDVPPKKRALPLIPSKPSQVKYLPPEFD